MNLPNICNYCRYIYKCSECRTDKMECNKFVYIRDMSKYRIVKARR